MQTVKFNFTLEADVARYLQNIARGQRSKMVNTILKEHILKEMTEGFKEPVEDFDSWEQLSFETWK